MWLSSSPFKVISSPIHHNGQASVPEDLRMSTLEASVELIDQRLQGGMPTNVAPGQAYRPDSNEGVAQEM